MGCRLPTAGRLELTGRRPRRGGLLTGSRGVPVTSAPPKAPVRTGPVAHGKASRARSGPGHPPVCPLPDLPRQHHRDGGVGQCPERPARFGESAAVGGEWVRPDFCQLDAEFRHHWRPPRPQEGDPVRRRRILRRLGGSGRCAHHRHPHRRPGDHGDWRCCLGARHTVDDPTALSRSCRTGALPRNLDRGVQSRAGPRSAHRGPAGVRLLVAGNLLGQRHLRRSGAYQRRRRASRRAQIRSGPGSTYPGCFLARWHLGRSPSPSSSERQRATGTWWIDLLFLTSLVVGRAVRAGRAPSKEPGAQRPLLQEAGVRLVVGHRLHCLLRDLRHLLHGGAVSPSGGICLAVWAWPWTSSLLL